MPLLSLLAKALPLIKKVPLLRHIPKGKATLSGAITAAVGLVSGAAAPHIITDQNIVAVLQAVAEIVVALGGVVAAFGGTRKVVYTAADKVSLTP